MLKPGALDQLQQVHELNRAFLGLLQTRVRQSRPCLALPAAAAAPLATVGAALLEAAAAFPRALFQIEIPPHSAPVTQNICPPLDEAEHDLNFSILFAARQASRQSAYQARLLFGLEGLHVERFGASTFAELQRLGWISGVVQCAFRDRPWFWHSLLTATRPEVRRHLALLALQPCLAGGWPQRRPPQSIV
jgi:hypothetical protein